MKQTYLDLQLIFQDYFGIPDLILVPEMSANDIEQWDSLTHFELIGLIEDHFRIRFDLDQVVDFKNIEDIAKGIRNQLNKS